MANLYNAGQLATIITKMGENDVPELGTLPNTYIYLYLNIIMMKYARIADVVKYSDPLVMSADGEKIFTQAGNAITDMFEPMQIYDPANPSSIRIDKRTSDEAPKGWWREANNTEIYIRGFSLASQPLAAGSYILKYKKYPARVAIDGDIVEFSPAGYDVLIKETLAMIKASRNSYGGMEVMDRMAKVSLGEATQAAQSAKSTGSTGTPIGPVDTAIGRGN